MSLARVDQKSSSAVRRRSSLIVNLSTSSSKKRSSITTLTTSSSLSSRSSASTCISSPPASPLDDLRQRLSRDHSCFVTNTRVRGASPQSAPVLLSNTNYNMISEYGDTQTNNNKPNMQVTEVSNESETATAKPPCNNSHEDEQQDNTKENSPEPIIEVKNTSSSSNISNSSAGSNANDSSDENQSRRLIRRRTVRRYHRATEAHCDSTESKTTQSNSKTHLLPIDRREVNPLSGGSSRKAEEDLGVQSHFRTVQIGAYYGATKQKTEREQEQTSTSKTAKCSTITTNRKSTTSSRQVISESAESSSSSSSKKQKASMESAAAQSLSTRLSLNPDESLFERATTGRVVERQEEEESSVRHKECFSSQMTKTRARAPIGDEPHLSQAATFSVSEAASQAASISHHRSAIEHSNGAAALVEDSVSSASSNVIRSSKRSLRTIASPIQDDHQQAFLLPNSESLFTSPDVRSLVRDIGTDFAELESALSSTQSRWLSSSASRSHQQSSLSDRLFGKRLFSSNRPISYKDDNESPAALTYKEESSAMNQSLKMLGNSTTTINANRRVESGHQSQTTNESPIKELLNRVQDHADRLSNSPSPVEPFKSQEKADSKTPFVVSKCEKLDQRMSDLCKSLEECNKTEKAIDLLKIMIQMIEKAWSVPVCGDDLGFELCNSLRQAGGLANIVNFITRAYRDYAKEGTEATENNRPPMQTSSSSTDTTTFRQLEALPIAPQSQTKDSDSDILTSDLGLDSTSVESLSYVSASGQPAENAASKQQSLDNNETEDDLDLSNGTAPATTTVVDETQATPPPKEPTTSQLEEEALMKDELTFLSARLLSQCLMSENRNYIVKNGLDEVIQLACSFTTMKSRRLLSRSLLMRQSSTIHSNSKQLRPPMKVHSKCHEQTTTPRPVSNMAALNATTSITIDHTDSLTTAQEHSMEQTDMHSIIGTEILQHLFKHSEDTCSRIISLGGLQAILYGCRSSSIEILRHCASALANLALYGGPDSQQTMVEQKAHVWLFPLAFNEDDNVQYYACLAIVALAANQEIEADVLKSSTLDLVEPFVTTHEPRRFAESTTAHIHGQSASWLRKLMPLLESKREETRNLACFHFAMEAHIKREQGQTHVFKEIGAVEPLRRAGSSPIAISSKFACQALRLIGEPEPHRLSQQVPLWTCEDVVEWVSQIGFESFRPAFIESRVDGDLLLQLNESMLRNDIGIENGIIRRRFLRELSNLKRIADYNSVDKTGLSQLLLMSSQQHQQNTTTNSSTKSDLVQYIYPLVQSGVTKDNIHLLDCEQLLTDCQINNAIHRLTLARTIKELQERVAIEAASNERLAGDGGDHHKTLDVFVSYRRSTGSQLASLLKVHLQLRGFSVFIDVERLEAGKFDNNLLDSVRAAKNFILVMSPGALDRCIGDHECKDWVHKEIVAALASNCNIIPIIDNFHWPDTDQLPEDMRSISYFNGVRWIHDYQDACVDKVERFIRGELSNGTSNNIAGSSCYSTTGSLSSAQSTMQRCFGGASTPSLMAASAATPSLVSGQGGFTPHRIPLDADHHPLSLASLYQHSQQQQQQAALRRQ